MSRITKKTLRGMLALVGKEYNIPTSREQAQQEGRSHYLALDYYNPGGNPYQYKLVVVNAATFNEHGSINRRFTGQEMHAVLYHYLHFGLPHCFQYYANERKTYVYNQDD